jgi:hypothetical protein
MTITPVPTATVPRYIRVAEFTYIYYVLFTRRGGAQVLNLIARMMNDDIMPLNETKKERTMIREVAWKERTMLIEKASKIIGEDESIML